MQSFSSASPSDFKGTQPSRRSPDSMLDPTFILSQLCCVRGDSRHCVANPFPPGSMGRTLSTDSNGPPFCGPRSFNVQPSFAPAGSQGPLRTQTFFGSTDETTAHELVAQALDREGRKEHILAAAHADAIWDMSPTSEQKYAIGIVALIGNRGLDCDVDSVALVGMTPGNIRRQYHFDVVIPFVKRMDGIEVTLVQWKSCPPSKERFCLVLHTFEGKLGSDDPRVAAQFLFMEVLEDSLRKARSKDSVSPDSFPSPDGAFNWVWSYSPPAVILESHLETNQVSVKQAPIIGSELVAPVFSGGDPDLSVLVVTMNCFGEGPPADPANTLAPLFKIDDDRKSPSLVVVCLQETCNLSYAYLPTFGADARVSFSWAVALEAGLHKALPKTRYAALHFYSLIGMALIVYGDVDKDTAATIAAGSISSEARCGRWNAGNKGAVSVSLGNGALRLCITSLHLHAGGDASVRANDSAELIHQLRFDDGDTKMNVFEHDLVIWAGDFNSRLGHGTRGKEVHDSDPARIAAMTLASEDDEVFGLLQRRTGIWGLLEEAPIDFPPTYKLKPGKADVYDETRAPAWCDRIVWWARPRTISARPIRYRCVNECLLSDHKPVTLLIDVTAKRSDTGSSEEPAFACTQQ